MLLEQRNKFIEEVNMSDFDNFDISKIKDNIKRRKLVSTDPSVERYEIVPSDGYKCIITKDKETKEIVKYESSAPSKDYYKKNEDGYVQFIDGVKTVVEYSGNITMIDKVEDDGLRHSRMIVDHSDSIKLININDEEYYAYEIKELEDDMIEKITYEIYADEFNQFDKSKISFGDRKISGEVYHSDGRMDSKYNSALYYEKYYYTDGSISGILRFNPSINKITEEVRLSPVTSVYIDRKISDGSGYIKHVSDDISIIKPSDSFSTIILESDYVNNIDIEVLTDQYTVISNGNGEVSMRAGDEFVRCMSDDGTESTYIENSYVKLPQHYMHNPDFINVVGGSRESVGTGLDVFRLNGVISYIRAISRDLYGKRILYEDFVFGFDSQLKEIHQLYYEDEVVHKTNIIRGDK